MSFIIMNQEKFGGIGMFKLGRFFFDRNDQAALQTLFSDLLVISAEPDWSMDGIIYKAYSQHFKKLENGQIIPTYIPTISVEGSDEGTNYYKVTWEETKY